MRSSLKLGRVLGIELRVDVSWFLIVLLLTWSLTAMFGGWHPEWSGELCLAVGSGAALLLFASVLFHEMAHALAARGLGVPVRDITLHMFGGVASLEREPPTPGAELLIAVVGPLASIGLGIASLLLAAMGLALLDVHPGGADAEGAIRAMGPFTTLLMWLGPANIVVGLFNLVPGFPLDGGRILRAAIWKWTGDLGRATRATAVVGQVMGWGLVATGALMAFGVEVPFFGTGLVGGLWLALIGMFLRNAAVQSYLGAAIADLMTGVRASDLMRTGGAWVDVQLPVDRLVGEWFLGRDETAYPVFDDGRFAGMVCLDDIRRSDKSRWATQTAGDVMTPREALATIGPDEEMVRAMQVLAARGVRQLPVVVPDGELVGMRFEKDIARWLEMQSAPGTARGAALRPRRA
jgi:Zn-dependent protease